MIRDSVIQAILKDLGVEQANYNLTIEIGDCPGRGRCGILGTDLLVILKYPDIQVLAHELKHAEQHISGLSEWMDAERELTEYKDRWYEVEARDYASKYE